MMGPKEIVDFLSIPILLQSEERVVIAPKRQVSYHIVGPLSHKISLYPYLHLLIFYHE